MFGISSNIIALSSQSPSRRTRPAGAGPAAYPTATGWDETSTCPIMFSHRYQ